MKYPVKVTYPNIKGTHFKMLTLVEANEKFAVVQGYLVEQIVTPITEAYAEERLKYALGAIEDLMEYMDGLNQVDHKDAYLRLLEYKQDAVILEQAVAFFKNV